MQHYIYTQAAVWIYVYLCLAQKKREKNFSTQLFKGPSCILQSGGTPTCAYFFLSLGSWLHHHALYTVCIYTAYIPSEMDSWGSWRSIYTGTAETEGAKKKRRSAYLTIRIGKIENIKRKERRRVGVAVSSAQSALSLSSFSFFSSWIFFFLSFFLS